MSWTIRSIEPEDKKQIRLLAAAQWGGSLMIVHDQVFELTRLPGFIACDEERTVGLITYRLEAGVMEILSLNSLCEQQGIGSRLLAAVIGEAELRKMKRLYLTTTNDNLNALGFYQKRGFTLTTLRIGAVNRARLQKPSIPLKSAEGIPIEHELELDYVFPKSPFANHSRKV